MEIELPEERRIRLLQVIKQKGSATVSKLSKQFKVSEVTIRRDLKKLEERQYVKCSFGGVLSLEKIERELSLDERIVLNLDKKRRIGSKTASLIKNNDTLFISTGTTTREIVQNIDETKNIVIATNCLWTGYELSKYSNIRVIVIGGEIRRPSYALIGPKAVKCIEDMVIDKFFLGVEGLSPDYGIAIASEFEAEICRKVMKLSKQTIVVADSTKFGKVALSRIADIDAVNTIITDVDIEKKYLQLLQKRVEIILC